MHHRAALLLLAKLLNRQFGAVDWDDPGVRECKRPCIGDINHQASLQFVFHSFAHAGSEQRRHSGRLLQYVQIDADCKRVRTVCGNRKVGGRLATGKSMFAQSYVVTHGADRKWKGVRIAHVEPQHESLARETQ